MIEIQRDKNNQPFIQWQQFGQGWKRAWIQRRTGDKDWAETVRYINVVQAHGATGGPAGNATDFPSRFRTNRSWRLL
ncbi:MAG: hypothetical protein ABSD88_01095 [Candidatus Korobacteraceae bacterium]